MSAVALSDSVLDELVGIVGAEGVFAGISARINRARVPAPFPVHRWREHVPDVVVLPTTAEQVSEVVKLANRRRIPVVPRAGGTGLTDGAVPLRGGILVDVKLMNRILEIDVEDRTVTVQPGINMLKLSEELRPLGFIYPDDPASYPCSRGRAHRHQRLVADRRALRPHPGPGHQLPDGAAHRGDHRGRRRRRAQDPQVVERLPAQAPLHGPPGDPGHRHRGHARAGDAPRGRVRRLLLLPRLRDRLALHGGPRALGARHAGRRRALRRVEDRLPAPRRRGLHPPAAGREGGGRDGDVRDRRRGAAGGQAPAEDRPGERRRLPGRRDLPGRLGLAATTATPRRCTAACAAARWCR